MIEASFCIRSLGLISTGPLRIEGLGFRVWGLGFGAHVLHQVPRVDLHGAPARLWSSPEPTEVRRDHQRALNRQQCDATTKGP